MEVEINLTASHKGHFEFRIGAFDERETEGDEVGKLRGHLMELVCIMHIYKHLQGKFSMFKFLCCAFGFTREGFRGNIKFFNENIANSNDTLLLPTESIFKYCFHPPFRFW